MGRYFQKENDFFRGEGVQLLQLSGNVFGIFTGPYIDKLIAKVL